MRINENNYVDKAEEAIKSLVEESKQKCRAKSKSICKTGRNSGDS